jgi:hypothetical protein
MLSILPAQAQRRDRGPASGVFQITLTSPVRFGDVVVPPRNYRLTLSHGGFALADADSMVHVATVPVEASTGHATVATATVEVDQQGETVTLVMRYSDRVLEAVGTATEPAVPEPIRVVLAGKRETLVDTKISRAETTDLENVVRALKRYRRSLQHCTDAAHRSRWQTDDPRFVRCVCPIIERWRLPKVSTPLRVHRPLAKGRSGFSFTVTVEGKVTGCRVWIGAAPPADENDAKRRRAPEVDVGLVPPPAKAEPEPVDRPLPAESVTEGTR